MSETPSPEIRSFLLDLVAELGPGLLAASRERGDLTAKTSFHDVVTVHDEATEAKIRDAILTRFPDSHFLGEESGWSTVDGPSEGPGDDDLYWLVDPIDGTSNFAAGWDYWCISIAAVRGGELRASAVHQPLTGRTWSADDNGAYLDEPGRPTRVLQVDPTVVPRDGLCMTEYPSVRVARDDSALVRWRDAASEFRSMRRTGSTALDLCFVADGSGIASFSTGTNPWDVAAGIHILQKAGAIYESYTDSVPTEPVWDGSEYIAAASQACLQVSRTAMGL